MTGVDTIEEVWFRGAHCDIVGGPNAYWPLADITLDWMLDGVVKAGAIIRAGARQPSPAPTELDALAEGARSLHFRKVPDDALVHASVDVYLRAHPDYWRRLPRAHRLVRLGLGCARRASAAARHSAGGESITGCLRCAHRGRVVTQTHCHTY